MKKEKSNIGLMQFITIIPNAALGCKQILLSRKAAKLAKCNTIFFLAFFAAWREISKNIFVKITKFLGIIEYSM